MRFTFRTLFFLCALAVLAMAQEAPAVPPPQHKGILNPPIADEEDARTRIAHDLEKKAARDRVAALKTDTDRLLKLSVELKQYVDKSDENVLSLDVVRRAEAIEKLAKSVKEKMKGPN